MDGRLESPIRSGMRALGLAAVVCAVFLSWPGVRAVRADEATPPPDSSEQPAAETASFEGFASYMQANGRPVAVIEQTGPTCSQRSALAPEIAHRAAIARLQAKMIVELQARGAGEAPAGVVILNNQGYNYRPAGPSPPAR